MVDLHMHILPGIDDGSDDMAMSLEMARIAAGSGVDSIVATPHSNQTGRFENYISPELDRSFRMLAAALRKENIPLKLFSGMEIYCTEDTPRKIRDGLLHGINGTHRFLVEFPFDAYPEWIEDRLSDLRDIGVAPLIAHPERYYCIQDRPAYAKRFVRLGCLIQINKGSIMGRFGRRAKRTADILLEKDLVTCVASDAHSDLIRTPDMTDILEELIKRYGRSRAERLLETNPRRIILGRPIPRH